MIKTKKVGSESLETLSFPEYSKDFGSLLVRGIHAIMTGYEPILGEIGMVPKDHLPETNISSALGRSSGFDKISASSEIKIDSVLNTDIDKWYEFLSVMGIDMASETARMLFSNMNRIISETGNFTNSLGKKISHDAILDMLEKMDFEVDDNDKPVGLSLVVNHTTMQAIQNLGPKTTEQEARYENIIAHKKKVMCAKKRIRKLVDRS